MAMTWLTDNFATLLVVLGVALLVIEVGVFGFSLFILFFIGLACILSGILMAIGILPESMVMAFGSVALLSLAFAFSLWKPLKRMQDSGGNKDIKGEFVGHISLKSVLFIKRKRIIDHRRHTFRL